VKVLVLGCGPAGLMAAHAAALNDCDIIIVSKARKSFMKGAQYLHKPNPPFKVSYTLLGTPQQYRIKVYGDLQTPVSPEDLLGDHEAWDIRLTYDWLWNAYGPFVKDDNLNVARVDEVLQWCKPDIAISTIPASMLCLEGHSFSSQRIWSSNQPMKPLEDNTVVCNGENIPHWYRAARIQGWDTVEWPHYPKPPITNNLWEVEKPLMTNCTCFPDVHRMGRYGKWQKGVLSHEAYDDMIELLHQGVQEAMF
jgi:hypothetical protein